MKKFFKDVFEWYKEIGIVKMVVLFILSGVIVFLATIVIESKAIQLAVRLLDLVILIVGPYYLQNHPENIINKLLKKID
jgi:hypothetical protein